MVSMSTGELKVTGNLGAYTLRMPAYEVAHIANPGQALLEHIHFRSDGAAAKLLTQQCSLQGETYLCNASYQFPAPPDVIDADCTFASITVPNHVHMLRAYKGDKTDQAVFDLSFTDAELRFRPPAPWEIFVRESGAGFLRAVGGLAPLLFLLSLALAARSRRELILLTAAFLVGEVASCILTPQLQISFSPRFIEAAAALTIAYLAFEIVLLPQSGQRWLVAGVLGLFHGAYFSLFLVSTSYHLSNFLSGVICGEVLILALLGIGLGRARKFSYVSKSIPVLASVLLTIGVVWFVVRIWA